MQYLVKTLVLALTFTVFGGKTVEASSNTDQNYGVVIETKFDAKTSRFVRYARTYQIKANLSHTGESGDEVMTTIEISPVQSTDGTLGSLVAPAMLYHRDFQLGLNHMVSVYLISSDTMKVKMGSGAVELAANLLGYQYLASEDKLYGEKIHNNLALVRAKGGYNVDFELFGLSGKWTVIGADVEVSSTLRDLDNQQNIYLVNWFSEIIFSVNQNLGVYVRIGEKTLSSNLFESSPEFKKVRKYLELGASIKM